jgi:hypothetical protein
VTDVLAHITFAAEIVEWRGPAPFLFVPVPEEHVAELRYAAREASYGWGCVPVAARIGETDFTTAVFPRGEAYYLPVKVAVQRAESVVIGDRVEAAITVNRR